MVSPEQRWNEASKEHANAVRQYHEMNRKLSTTRYRAFHKLHNTTQNDVKRAENNFHTARNRYHRAVNNVVRAYENVLRVYYLPRLPGLSQNAVMRNLVDRKKKSIILSKIFPKLAVNKILSKT